MPDLHTHHSHQKTATKSDSYAQSAIRTAEFQYNLEAEAQLFMHSSYVVETYSSRLIRSSPRHRTVTTVQNYYPAIGVLRANWKDKKRENVIINYGTAFAVSPRLILTCNHTIFYQKFHVSAHQIAFLPGIHNESASTSQKFWATKPKYYQAKCIIRHKQTLTLEPIPNQLCLIVLDQPLRLQRYVKIGSLKLKAFQELQIVGYPSKCYSKTLDLAQIVPQRVHLKGNLVQTHGCILIHNMPTEVGNSGGPIFARGQNGSLSAVGMHSHKGPRQGLNSGLFFNKKMLKLLYLYQKRLSQENCLLERIFFTNDKGKRSLKGSRVYKSEQIQSIKRSVSQVVEQSEYFQISGSDSIIAEQSYYSSEMEQIQPQLKAARRSEVSEELIIIDF